MIYKQVKDLKPSQFNRLCGVQPETVEQMVRVVPEARTERGIEKLCMNLGNIPQPLKPHKKISI